jgi:predicted deacetylase
MLPTHRCGKTQLRPVRPFLVCLHDVTPAYAGEIRVMIRDLAPMVGRRVSLGIVPNWHRQWPLAAYPEFCRLVQEASEELLLHGYFHQRHRGSGPVSFLAEGSDEMNGLNMHETLQTIERGQNVFADVFGERARGFLAPGWQRGRVRRQATSSLGLEHVLGFFSLDPRSGRAISLATWTWDCGRWAWLGHVGHGVGWLRQTLGGGVPTLAIHPRDLTRGFWPRILRLTRELLDRGYVPTTPVGLLDDGGVAAACHEGICHSERSACPRGALAPKGGILGLPSQHSIGMTAIPRGRRSRLRSE